MTSAEPHSQSEQSESSINDVIASAQDALQSKQFVLLALSNVVKAEVGLAKKATLVAFFATLGVFTFSCFCWLFFNIAVGFLLISAFNINVAVGSLLLLLINAAVGYLSFVILKRSVVRISLTPTFEAIAKGLFNKVDEGE